MMLLSNHALVAQDQVDSLGRRNSIKYHSVTQVLYSNTLVLSYERIVKPHQSFAVMAGYIKFPTLANLGSNIDVEKDNSKNGFMLGGEYRFYLKKENKYQAPHGVFIGPYLNLYDFGNDRTITIPSEDETPTQVKLSTDITVVNLGFQLGYQFVINNRWTIDMVVIGLSVSNYNLKANIDGNISPSDEDLVKGELLEALLERFPVLEDLLEDKEIDVRGTNSAWAPGFRYQLNFGYRFGKVRK
jgi:hypothetical protein